MDVTISKRIESFNARSPILNSVVLCSILAIFLTSCASSSVSRNAASQVDNAYQKSNDFVTQRDGVHPIESFQNASQLTQGAIIGGATGAIAVGVTSGAVGILPGAAGGAVIGGVLGAYLERHMDIVDRLENRGIKVLILGDQVMIVLPSAWTFRAMTAEILPQAYSSLDLIAQLIRGYITMSVKISAYTNDTGDQRVNCVVSQAQASSVMKYLWSRMNTRVLSAGGYGGTHLIERNNLNWDQGANYRVEITLEKLPT